MEGSTVRRRLHQSVGVAATLLLASLLTAPCADAATVWRANWRVEGYVGQAPAGTKPEAHVILLYSGKEYPFDLTAATVVTGRVPPRQLLDDIEHHQMRLLLRGQPDVLDGLLKAAPGTKLVIFGHHDGGWRDLKVTKISAASTSSTPAAK
jgi:hypothetical protein